MDSTNQLAQQDTISPIACVFSPVALVTTVQYILSVSAKNSHYSYEAFSTY